ncbi:MAG: MaoC family dehydratase [Nanoarchaeota archaeon]
MKLSANDYNYEEINVGDTFEFSKVLTTQDIDKYADLTGDHNPLHCDEEYALSTEFKNRVVHGMLAGSLFSTLVGMVCPGKKNLYLTQSLKFKSPVYPDSELTVRGKILKKIDSLKVIVITTEILVRGETVIEGEAKVKLI